MTSSELKLKNAQYRQQVIEAQKNSAFFMSDSPLPVMQATLGIVEVGNMIGEQICELREAVERLTNSLPKSEPKNEVEL